MSFPCARVNVSKKIIYSFKKDPETYITSTNAKLILENPLFANAMSNVCSHFENYADQTVARIGMLVVYDLASKSAQTQGQRIPSITSHSIDALIPSLKDTDEWKKTPSEELGNAFLERIRTERPYVAETLEALIPPNDLEGTGKNALLIGGMLAYFLIAWQIDADNLQREIAL